MSDKSREEQRLMSDVAWAFVNGFDGYSGNVSLYRPENEWNPDDSRGKSR